MLLGKTRAWTRRPRICSCARDESECRRDSAVLQTAGEIGYSVGGCWTSMSGFTAADDAGSVQCAALGVMLQSCQLRYWDLGMSMRYKMQMGAQNVSRKRFLTMLRAVRDSSNARPLSSSPQPAALFLRPCCSMNDRIRQVQVMKKELGTGTQSGEGVEGADGTVVAASNGLFVRVRWDGSGQEEEVRWQDVVATAVSDALLADLVKSASSTQVPLCLRLALV